MTLVLRTALIASLLWAPAFHRQAPTSVPASAPGDPALSIAGNPESASGATWTLLGTLDGTTVDLQGTLLKPRGRGPFPAVVLSHGAGGNAQSYGRALGSVMRTWGLVCIAVNYTHANGAPPGTPGTLLDQGASPANAFRAHAAVTVLARLRYVDIRRVAARSQHGRLRHHGVCRRPYPADVRVASHTSGGVLLDAIHHEGMPAPSVAQARRIQAPYQWHHGSWTTPSRSCSTGASTPFSPHPMRAISMAASVTPRSPPIPCCRAFGRGTPLTGCSGTRWRRRGARDGRGPGDQGASERILGIVTE